MSVTTKPNVLDILHTNQEYMKKSRSFLIWLPVNIVLLAVILCDLWKNQRPYKWIGIFEHLMAVILSLNILYLSIQRFLIQYFPKKYHVSLQQFSLLQQISGILQGNYNVNVLLEENPPTTDVKKEKFRFENFQASSSPLFANSNTSPKSESLNDSMKEKFPVKRYHASPSSLFANAPVVCDAHETSLINSYGNSGSMNVNSSVFSSNLSNSLSSPSRHAHFQEVFSDEVDVARRYVQSPDFKHTLNLNDSGEYWRRSDGSFFRSHHSRRSSELVLNDVYQLSSTTTLEFVKPVNEVSSLGANPAVCKKFGINQSFLPEWIANLRMWITQTILTRIIKEIEEVNQALTCQGITNVSIGSTGLERLKKTAAMSQVYQNIPSLSSLISFLDISLNQEYVVQRISALSTGSMSNYCWNAGGSYEGKPWNESLPTDAALLPLPHTAPDGRQFSSAHYVKTPTELKKNKKSVIICQQSNNPPHFQLIIGEDTYDISRGRNNLFHVILFFLHHIKTKESCMFEHVNLGSSGINMLWVISDPSYNLYKKSL
ncbi:transmembrane protein 209 isoform X2 [Planococcus citri]|uniref:transmembrane protein 209 isoform X2 n=1 Tax=Planococcus citri TaxID=170843 RepID=UPI0031F8018C